jgi:hypothetical protein
MLAYGVACYLIDEYLRMSKTNILELMYKFCKAIFTVFSEVCLREPNVDNIARVLLINEARWFPGMIESIDCMYWEWKNSPFAFSGTI